MENIERMRERHQREISKLQRYCKHKETKRMPYMWAPGHFSQDVEVCSYCGKMKRGQYRMYTPKASESHTTSSDIDYKVK